MKGSSAYRGELRGRCSGETEHSFTMRSIIEAAVPNPRRVVGMVRTGFVSGCGIGRREGCTEYSVEVCVVPESIDEAEIDECWWDDDDCPRQRNGFVFPMEGVREFYYHGVDVLPYE